MPEMDGLEATKAIRAGDGAWSKIPIIALTASALMGERDKCLAAGMNDYLAETDRPGSAGAYAERVDRRPAAVCARGGGVATRVQQHTTRAAALLPQSGPGCADSCSSR